jgi:DNA mismatch repair protein MutS2
MEDSLVEIAVGATVKLKGHPGVSAVVLKEVSAGNWLVQAGSMKLAVMESEMTPIAPAQGKVLVDYSDATLAADKPAFELRLLGLRAPEALKLLEHQVDLAAFHGLGEFSVIHGKGDGILQEAVWAYLSKSPVVASQCFAPPEDGGTGKTYVTVRQ